MIEIDSCNLEHRFGHYLNRTIEPPSEEDYTIAFYGSHNASITIAKGSTVLEVVEIERILNYKNSGLAQYKVPNSNRILEYTRIVSNYLHRRYGVTRYKTCLYQNTDVILGDERHQLAQFFPADSYVDCLHHFSHAAGCFYQSPYQKALAVTVDGGGNDGIFHIYLCERGKDPQFLAEYYNDLGFNYMIFGEFLGDIKQESSLSDGNLVYPGKIMGLVSYGSVYSDWIPHFESFFKTDPSDGRYRESLNSLSAAIGVTFDSSQRLYGRTAYDIAATAQRAFENVLYERIMPFMKRYPDLPICFSGGCALNILANTRLVEQYGKQVFVGPNPNDCGLSLGMMLSYLKPAEACDATYLGTPLFDIDLLAIYLEERNYDPEHADIKRVAKLIAEGKILGVARGRSEHGPRALGNRSIICNPALPDMKDILNAKVKHREWYRPFAPVVRLEDVNEYFEWDQESRWMSFAPIVREKYRSLLPSITHVDNTARVQTVTAAQNPFLYQLITEVKELTGIGVILNTSFNVDGKPILSSLKDAFKIMDHTELDGLVVEDTLIMKRL